MKFLRTLYIKLFIKKQQTGSDSTELNKFFSDAKSFVVIMPEIPAEFSQAITIPRYLKGKGKKVTVVVPSDLQQSLNSQDYDELYPYSLTEQNRYGFPVPELREKLSAITADIVVDAHLHEEYFSYLITKEINSHFKVGFIKPLSDKFYNIQIAVNSVSPEVCYKNFLNCLEMF